MSSELLDRFMSVTGFLADNHVRFAFEDGGDPFAQHRMVINSENPNGIVGVHISSLSGAGGPAVPGNLLFRGFGNQCRSHRRGPATKPSQIIRDFYFDMKVF